MTEISLRVKVIGMNRHTLVRDLDGAQDTITIDECAYNINQDCIFYDYEYANFYNFIRHRKTIIPTIMFYENCPEAIVFIKNITITGQEYPSALYSEHIILTANMLTKCYKKPKREIHVDDMFMVIVGICAVVGVMFYIMTHI